ncbi:hypothetical protein V8G54_006715 [Vigna mungo]|uniref:Retrotransposon gag domain-containing protein n=1 Tax=Vigna mungo TaxID=3915 RepID=A0AAQ3P101_VIGMU
MTYLPLEEERLPWGEHLLEPNRFGPTCRIFIGGENRARVKKKNGEKEELKVEMRAVTRELQAFGRALGRRTGKQDWSSDESRDSVNAEWEQRLPKSSEDESEEDRGEVRRSWRKHAEKFFDLHSVMEKEKMKLVYLCVEGGASYWFRFWRKKTRHLTWKMFTDALTRRFGDLNRGTVFEELAAEFEILVPQASGKRYHSSFSVPVDLGASIITGVEANVATD